MTVKTLKQAMQSLRIETTGNGYELHSPAGIAFYDHWGSRGEVRGIPEYFPTHLSVRGVSREGDECDLELWKKSVECQISDLMAAVASNAVAKQADADAFKNHVSDIVEQCIKRQQMPGGLLHRS